MSKVVILMMDSFGIGGAKDAAKFGDESANTFKHIAENYPLSLPNLESLGLNEATKISCQEKAPLKVGQATIGMDAKYGAMDEISAGKDTISGHWEMAGLPVLKDFGHFSCKYPSFPKEMINKICQRFNINGILGNCGASGTVIIQDYGEEHIKTGKPIFYTSADSNLQIAAHEEYFGLDRLYQLCEIAFAEVKPYNIGRVIARPFIGERKGEFVRTKNRHDYALSPFGKTILDRAKEQGIEVIGIGKIPDIYANSGITAKIRASGLEELWDVTLSAIKNASQKSIIFTNFVDFDMQWGHRRDVKGYAEGLMYFDKRLPEIASVLSEEDIVFITADHGCDPTYKGTDHTRERVPVIMFGKNVHKENVGLRATYADIAKTIAEKMNIKEIDIGKSFL